MKKIKIYGVVFSMIFGVIISIETNSIAQEISDPNTIPCWSAGTKPFLTNKRYVECASCTSVKGIATGGAGNCEPNPM